MEVHGANVRHGSVPTALGPQEIGFVSQKTCPREERRLMEWRSQGGGGRRVPAYPVPI